MRSYVSVSYLILEVEGDGAGIIEEEQLKVFHSFVRDRHAKGLGSGLVMAIVNDMAGIHKANLP